MSTFNDYGKRPKSSAPPSQERTFWTIRKRTRRPLLSSVTYDMAIFTIPICSGRPTNQPAWRKHEGRTGIAIDRKAGRLYLTDTPRNLVRSRLVLAPLQSPAETD